MRWLWDFTASVNLQVLIAVLAPDHIHHAAALRHCAVNADHGHDHGQDHRAAAVPRRGGDRAPGPARHGEHAQPPALEERQYHWQHAPQRFDLAAGDIGRGLRSALRGE